ncbi:MAG TPA: hydantoinase/oxoprolinase family protein [Acidimicrobiia bacterium]|nr:hydantoinase/oxoprolinase family protein [Acidimicrobiia bacterium]
MARQFQIGCDIGGTFTDVAVVDSDGLVVADKADTTRGDLGVGMLRALENAAGQLDLPLEELLGATTRFVNGTTLVTNSIAELEGARAGLITTKGHGDVLRIARSPRNHHRDHHLQRNLPQIVPRERVVEVEERVDRKGRVVVALREEEARRAVDELCALGVEAIAVCLLWSSSNPAHEEQLARLIEAEHPDVYVSVSSRLHPVMREYERTMTTVLNCFTGLRVARYTRAVEDELCRRGLRVPISFMQGFGGTLSADEARQRPITLVDSGPAGGVVGAARLAGRLGIDNLLAADMGGTSFDVTVLPAGEITVTQRVMLGERFLTGLSKIDVHPVGAGGGSVGWIDVRGVPRVGPRSAGAEPGPACYGQGGTEPTVTDACVALGIIDPGCFLGGRRRLDADLASQALTRFGEPLGLDAEQAASAIYRLVTAEMGHAVRAVTVERGRDPRQFVMAGFGGALGIFGADIARRTGIARVIVPAHAAVFSAFGLLGTDDVRALARSAPWVGGDAGHVDAVLKDLEHQAVSSLRDAGFPDDRIEVVKQGDFKFAGQLWELTLPIAHQGSVTTGDLEAVQAAFPARYEAEYGAGTAWNVPVVMLTARVVARGVTDKLEPAGLGGGDPGDGAGARIGSRRIRRAFEDAVVDADAYDALRLAPGTRLAGPAVVEHPFTTIQVPGGWALRVDGHGNFLMDDTAGAPGRAVDRDVEVAPA